MSKIKLTDWTKVKPGTLIWARNNRPKSKHIALFHGYHKDWEYPFAVQNKDGTVITEWKHAELYDRTHIHWIEHDGGDCPVDYSTKVCVDLGHDSWRYGSADGAWKWSDVKRYFIVEGE